MQILWMCDKPTRIPARIFMALRVECECCTFWRGWLLGVVTALVAGAIVRVCTS